MSKISWKISTFCSSISCGKGLEINPLSFVTKDATTVIITKFSTHDILSNLKKIPFKKNICVLKVDEYVMSFLNFVKITIAALKDTNLIQ